MAGFVDSLEASLLDHILGGGTYTRVDPVFIGLSTTTPADDGTNFTEPVGNNYGRVSRVNTSATWNTASGGTKTNSAAITFPQASGSWGTITHVGVFTATTGGTPIMWGTVTPNQAVVNTNTASFPIGTLSLSLDGGIGFGDTLENAILDHVLGGPNYTKVTPVFVGLSTTTPTDAGANFTEPATGAYARVSVTNNATSFPNATGGSKSNGIAINFAQASGDWSSGANMTHVGIFAALTGGVPFMMGALTVPQPVLNTNTASFPAAALAFTLD